jgi:hypothetical protein
LAARAAGKVLAQGDIKVAGHRHMPVFSAGDGEHFAIEVFMALGLRHLPGQIVFGSKNCFLYGLSHDHVLDRESVAHYERIKARDSGQCQSW